MITIYVFVYSFSKYTNAFIQTNYIVCWVCTLCVIIFTTTDTWIYIRIKQLLLLSFT